LKEKNAASHDQLITEPEAALLLGISLPSLRRWRYQRRGPNFVRFRRTIRYRRADLVAFIINHFCEGVDDAA
jgi:predicted DNA-binding transcriptional regulator AlpA